MTEGSALPPECDFCGHVYDEAEDDDRVPVYFGDPSVETRGDRWMKGTAVTDNSLHADENQAIHAAIRDAIDELPLKTKVGVSQGTKVVKAVGGREHVIDEISEFERRQGLAMDLDTSKLGVSVEVKLPRPEVEIPDPDMLVCPHCKAALQGDGDD